MTLRDGSRVESDKSYKDAGWATVGSESEGAPIWDVVAGYLRGQGTVNVDTLEQPVLEGVAGNPGIADY